MKSNVRALVAALAVIPMLFASCKESEGSGVTAEKEAVLELYGDGVTPVSEGVYSYDFGSGWLPGKSYEAEIHARVENCSVRKISFKNPDGSVTLKSSRLEDSSGTAKYALVSEGGCSAEVEAVLEDGSSLKAVINFTVGSRAPAVESYAVNVSDVDFEKDCTDSSVKLTWTVPALSGDDRYSDNAAERFFIEPGESCTVTENADGSFTAEISGLEADTEYDFKIYSYVISGENEAYGMGEKTARTHTDETAPAQPSAVRYSSDESSVTVEWTNPSDSDLKYINLSVGGIEGKDVRLEIPEGRIGKAYSYKIEGLPRKKESVDYTIGLSSEDASSNVSDTVSIKASKAADTDPPSVPEVKSRRIRKTSAQFVFEKADADAVSLVYWIGGSSESSSAEFDGTGIATVLLDLEEGNSYTVNFAVKDEAGNVSGETVVSFTAENPKAENLAAAAGYTGQIAVSWTKASEEGLYYEVTASPSSGDLSKVKTPVEKGLDAGSLAVSGLESGSAYNVSVAVYEKSGDEYNKLSVTESSSSVTARIVLYQLKSGANERMIHPAVRQSSYSLSYVTADGCQVVASDHDDKEDGPDFSRASSLYNYWVVMPGLSDPTDCEKFSLVASSPSKNGNNVTNPTYSGLYAVFDVEGLYSIPSGSVSSGVAGVNDIENKLIVRNLDDIPESSYEHATFTITENVSSKYPSGDNDSPLYKAYAFFRSESGLYFTQGCKIIYGSTTSTTDNTGIVARQEFFYEQPLDTSSGS